MGMAYTAYDDRTDLSTSTHYWGEIIRLLMRNIEWDAKLNVQTSTPARCDQRTRS